MWCDAGGDVGHADGLLGDVGGGVIEDRELIPMGVAKELSSDDGAESLNDPAVLV